MKIIHFADLHLGVETYGRIDPVTGLPGRFVDFLGSFDRVVEYSIRENADLVLFCGDAYKSRDPSQTQQREFACRVKQLSDCGIPVFLLVGNHDLPGGIGKATTTEIFDTLAVDNVYVSAKPETRKINTKSGPVQVVSLPWLKRSNVIAREDVRNLDIDSVNIKMRDILTGIIADRAAKLDPSMPALLAGHVWVHGASVGSEDGMTIGQEHTLLLSAVADKSFDYVALGHIHRQQVLSTSPPVVYSGSLERLDFGDEGVEKGFYVVDIDHGPGGHRTSYRFEQVYTRRFITLSISLSADDPAPTETIVRQLCSRSEEMQGAIVRLELIMPHSLQGLVYDGDIRESAGGAYYFAINKKVERKSRLRVADINAECMTPVSALEMYLKMKHSGSPDSELREIMDAGRRIIDGVPQL
jgi:exonuclease SbcD